jgi:hypothetical protein
VTGAAQGEETYRLRVENAEYGRVEVSLDGGQHYLLLGRVMHAADATTPDSEAAQPAVVARSGGDGLAFALGPRRILKLRPDLPPPTRGGRRAPLPGIPAEACAVTTDLPARTGLFGALTPPPGTPVRLQVSPQTLDPIQPGHPVSGDDLYVFLVLLPPVGGATADAWHETVRAQFADLARRYADGARERARLAGRKVVSGTLTLKAQLPAGEPDPIAAVTYAMDGDLLAGQNVGPYSYDWDTRAVADGEHVIEISAMNREGRQITHVRALIVVNNRPAVVPVSAGH